MKDTTNQTAGCVEQQTLTALGKGTLIAALMLLCGIMLFGNLGGPALFEPDEGRNAEKAREILLLQDWVTPHQNFVPVLDKPMPFYWLIALSYKVFGVSEFAARAPSAIAGLGCVVLVVWFALRFLGFWPALWSGLVLLASVEFYLLSRIVIFDMTLTFFITLALFCFYAGTHAESKPGRKLFFLLMYAAAGVAALVKGPIGAVLPGLIVLVYLLVQRRLRLLFQLELPLGCLLFLAIVAPWYIQAELRNPGYLRYFLWEENFIRYLTPHFNRTQSWYYFIVILSGGFLPWTLCLPAVISQVRRTLANEKCLFLVIWIVLPFLFFSFSKSKLPHYILPIYPPLALLTGATLAQRVKSPSLGRNWLLALPWLCLLLPVSFVTAGWMWPGLIPRAIRDFFFQVPPMLIALSAFLSMVFMALAVVSWRGRWQKPAVLYVGWCTGLALLSIFIGGVMENVSTFRSTRELVKQSAPFLSSDSQVAVVDTFFESLPYYLEINRPIWVVWSGAKRSIMGSFYVAEKRPKPVAGYGRVLFTYPEFDQEWRHAPKGHLLVFVKRKNLARLNQGGEAAAKVLLSYQDILLVTNQ